MPTLGHMISHLILSKPVNSKFNPCKSTLTKGSTTQTVPSDMLKQKLVCHFDDISDNCETSCSPYYCLECSNPILSTFWFI